MNKYFKLVSEISYIGGGIFRILLLLVKVECMGGYPLKYFYSLYIYWIEGFFFFFKQVHAYISHTLIS